MVCVQRNGVAAGVVDVGAARLLSFDGYSYNPNRPRVFLKALANDFIADTIEQRRSLCGPDYLVHPTPIQTGRCSAEGASRAASAGTSVGRRPAS